MTNEKGPLEEVPSRTGTGSGSSGQGAGAPDHHYDLISVLYHATHGAWNYDQYISDAESEGDDELAQFFRDVRDENAARAKRGKELLGKRLSR